jgi:tetratricopeptide (TPR) repeat protein
VRNARKSGDRTLESTALTNLGVAVRLTGDYARARDAYGQAAEISNAIGDLRARNAALNNSGTIDFVLGDLAAARQKFETALEVDRKLANPAGIALRLQNLSRVVALQNELAEAEKMNAEECAIQETLKAKTALAWCRTRLADIHFERGRKEDAAALAKQITVADLGSSVTGPIYITRYARLQLHLGNVAAAAGAIAAAEQVQLKAGAVEEQAIHVSVIRAEVEAAQGKRAAAVARLHRARADADQRGLVTWSKDAQRVLARIGS